MKDLLRKSILFLLTLSIGFGSCKKDPIDEQIDNNTPSLPSTGKIIVTSIAGEVLDENGNPVLGATVTIGSNTKQTNSNGLFFFSNVSVDENKAFIKVVKNGYFLGSRNIATRKNSTASVKIILLSNTHIGSFSSSSGGTISNSGVSLNFPANSVKNEGGGLYSGTVNVSLSYLNPNNSDIMDKMPGDLRALTTTNEEKLLETFGMVAIELTSQTGQKLNVANGKKVELTIPLSGTYLTEAPSTIPLWYFDETKGIWREEGSATKTGNSFKGEVSHFSFWNIDVPNAPTSISGTIKCENNVATNTSVTISTTSGRILGKVNTDNFGNFAGFIPTNTSLVIKVYSSTTCLGSPIYTANIGPYTGPIVLPAINACTGIFNKATLTGRLEDCSGNPITNGVLSVDVGGVNTYFYPDAFGNINSSLIYCSYSTVKVIGYDFVTLKSSRPITISTGTIINLDTIRMCDTINEFIHYTLDGTNYTVSSTNPINNLHIHKTVNTPVVTLVRCYNTVPSDGIFFGIRGDSIGTFIISNVEAGSVKANIGSFGVSGTITSFGSVGSYVIGTFSGTFVDNSAGSHTISGNFKLLRIPDRW